MNGQRFAGLSRDAGGETSVRARRGRRLAINNRISVDLGSGPTAISAARTALDAVAHRLDPHVVSDARLLVSELATNGVRHSGASGGSNVRLEAIVAAGTLRVEVTDAGSGFEPRPRMAGQSAGSGWGLYLVDRLSDRWGVRSDGGTTVWFEIDAVSARSRGLEPQVA